MIYNAGITDLKTIDESGKRMKSYECWRSMIRRCYSKKFHKKHPTYKECKVCEEWLYYSNFNKWYDENYYEIDGENMALDKDILHKENKLYSPETCIFVPQCINNLFTKRKNDRGEYPIGVCFDELRNKFRASCSIGKRNIKHLGDFNTPEEAFYCYKQFKENYIKNMAYKYKSFIPNKLYECMILYNY